MHHSCLAVLAAVLTLSPGALGMYSKKSDVLQVNAKNFDQLITKSNYTSIVEFYAPWCGYCKALKPDYEKVATSLKGIANVAAIDCDDESNRGICSSMGVNGYPTLKTVRPGKKYGRPVIEDYQGARKAKPIVDAMLPKINNHVTKVTDKDVDAFLAADGDGDKPKALLFSDKGTTGPILKAIAIDFLGVIPIGQVRNKEAETVAKYGVDKFPTLLLFPGEGKDPIAYEGEFKKELVVEFLSQAGEPNKPVPPKAGKEKKDKDNKEKKDKKEKDKKSKTEPEPETKTASTPTEQQTAPVIVESALPIPTIHTPEKLAKTCLHDKAGTCVLALISGADSTDEATQAVLDNLSELVHGYAQSKRPLFPVFVVPESNAAAASIQKALQLDSASSASSGPVTLVALNTRRGWWRAYDEGEDLSHDAIENWIDSIRMSEGGKKKLPATFVAVVSEEVQHEEL